MSTTYKTSGTFTAKVTVTDDSGATATATQTVTVGAVGPAAPANLRKSKSGKSGKLRYMDMAWDRRDGATNYEVRLSCVKCAEVISGQGTGTTLRITVPVVPMMNWIWTRPSSFWLRVSSLS